MAENQGEVHDSVQAFFILFVSALALFQILISSFSSFFILFFYLRINGNRYLMLKMKDER